MKLDVVVPTYNREALLRLTLASLLREPAPPELDITVFVMDNNSRDGTRAAVEELAREAEAAGNPRRVLYLHQPVQGLSPSRNAGIAAGSGDGVAMIDDDEQITPTWYARLAREFADPSLDFLGGPYLAGPGTVLPTWLPPGYNGVIGVTPLRPRQPMDAHFAGNLMGGNAAMRRRVFERSGMYNPALGRSGKGLHSEEDVDLYRRLLAAGCRGVYAPEFAILHHIPAERLTRRYYRRWCFWRGISQAQADRVHPEPVAHLLGLPRYRITEGLRGLLALLASLGRASGERFARELPLWTLLGFLRQRMG